jgi:hypothetical protein
VPEPLSSGLTGAGATGDPGSDRGGREHAQFDAVLAVRVAENYLKLHAAASDLSPREEMRVWTGAIMVVGCVGSR